MRITILAPSVKQPIGGVRALYEFANGLRRRDHDVCVAHVSFIGTWSDRVVLLPTPIQRVEDITWFRFEPGIEHRIVNTESELPPGDVISRLGPAHPEAAGLPFLFLQGFRVLPRGFERGLFTASCPKICIAEWLVGVGKEMGSATRQLIHIPYGLDHDLYRTSVDPAARPVQVGMCFGSHHTKGGPAGLRALELVKARFPELRAAVFGTAVPGRALPDWVDFHHLPRQRVIVDEIYNRSRVFVNPSSVEGFGLPSVEAMACGCALVTVANGGSDDYAFDGVTAAVCQSSAPAQLADRIGELLADDAERLRLAHAGRRFVGRFDWDESVRRLETVLLDYIANPERYR